MGFESQGAAVSLVAAMQDDVPLRAVASLVGFMPVVEPETAMGCAICLFSCLSADKTSQCRVR